jgi:hypothetical protein
MQQLAAVSLLSALILACCGTSGLGATCPDDDVSCFVQYAQAGCTPVSMGYTLDVPMMVEITGSDSYGNCEVKLTGGTEAEFRQLMLKLDPESASYIDAYLDEVDYNGNIAGKTAFCSVPPSGMYSFLTEGSYADTCTGSLMDGMMSIAR